MPTTQEVFYFVLSHPGCSSKQIASHFGVSKSEINRSSGDYVGVYSNPRIENRNHLHYAMTSEQPEAAGPMDAAAPAAAPAAATGVTPTGAPVAAASEPVVAAGGIRDAEIDAAQELPSESNLVYQGSAHALREPYYVEPNKAVPFYVATKTGLTSAGELKCVARHGLGLENLKCTLQSRCALLHGVDMFELVLRRVQRGHYGDVGGSTLWHGKYTFAGPRGGARKATIVVQGADLENNMCIRCILPGPHAQSLMRWVISGSGEGRGENVRVAETKESFFLAYYKVSMVSGAVTRAPHVVAGPYVLHMYGYPLQDYPTLESESACATLVTPSAADVVFDHAYFPDCPGGRRPSFKWAAGMPAPCHLLPASDFDSQMSGSAHVLRYGLHDPVAHLGNVAAFERLLAETRPEHDLGNCAICLDAPKAPAMLRCGHHFCSRCVRTWLLSNSSCPTCRAPASAMNIFEIVV